MEHPKKKDDDCVLAMGGPLFLEVKAPSEVVATVANHGRLVRELEVLVRGVCSSTIRFHHFCLVHERTSLQRVGTCISPILVTKRSLIY